MRTQRYSMIFVFAMLATACGKSSPTPQGFQDRDSHWIVTGPLSDQAIGLTEFPRAGSCDRAFRQIRVELASAIDQHADLINSSSDGKKGQDQRLIPFHDSFLVEVPVKKTESSEWVALRYSWQNAYRMYKASSKSQDAAFWSRLNQEVRGILTMDLNRTKYWVNYGIDRDDVKLLPELQKSLASCITEKECTVPLLTSDLFALVERLPVYGGYYDNLKKDSAKFSEKRDTLKYFSEQVDFDISIRNPTAYSGVSARKSGSSTLLEVSLYAPTFSNQDQEVLKKYIVPRWTTDQASVELKFVDRRADLVELFFGPEASGRSYVQTGAKKEMHLFPYNATTALAHEIGHVLGFPDHYQTVWDYENCVYTQWSQQGDIMNNSSAGEPTTEEWDWLLKTYQPK